MKNKRDISKIHIGLPEDLVERVYWPSRDTRTNPLSHMPGGSDVVIEFHGGSVFGYDWIKVPGAYIRAVLSKEVINTGLAEVSNLADNPDELRKEVHRVFARLYFNEVEYAKKPFEEIWDSTKPVVDLWVALGELKLNDEKDDSLNPMYDIGPSNISAQEYYGYEPDFESAQDRAERVYGIPDARLFEDG